MKKNISIEIPEGYSDVVFDAASKTLKYIKKVELPKPRCWQTYCERHKYVHKHDAYTPYDYDGFICPKFEAFTGVEVMRDSHRETLDKFDNLMKLYLLYRNWIKDCEELFNETCWKIEFTRNDVKIIKLDSDDFGFLTFPTEDMCVDFYKTFLNLLEDVQRLFFLAKKS